MGGATTEQRPAGGSLGKGLSPAAPCWAGQRSSLEGAVGPHLVSLILPTGQQLYRGILRGYINQSGWERPV